MKQTLKYKGYEGSAEFDFERNVVFGRVLCINDLVTYEAKEAQALVTEFESAVDDYLDTCAELERAPHKPFGGVFQLRLSPDEHREASLAAHREDCSLNEYVAIAVRQRLHGTNQVTVNLQVPEEAFKRLSSASAGDAVWGDSVQKISTGGSHDYRPKH